MKFLNSLNIKKLRSFGFMMNILLIILSVINIGLGINSGHNMPVVIGLLGLLNAAFFSFVAWKKRAKQ